MSRDGDISGGESQLLLTLTHNSTRLEPVTNRYRFIGRLRGATIARRQRRSCKAINIQRGNNTFVTIDRGQW